MLLFIPCGVEVKSNLVPVGILTNLDCICCAGFKYENSFSQSVIYFLRFSLYQNYYNFSFSNRFLPHFALKKRISAHFKYKYDVCLHLQLYKNTIFMSSNALKLTNIFIESNLYLTAYYLSHNIGWKSFHTYFIRSIQERKKTILFYDIF